MSSHAQTDARTLRARLSHPIVDADFNTKATEVNPDFFKGTVVEKAAAEVLARQR